jgi:hypothetical protein
LLTPWANALIFPSKKGGFYHADRIYDRRS